MIPVKENLFPLLKEVAYLDNITATPLPAKTVKVIASSMQNLFPSFDMSVHSMARQANDRWDDALTVIKSYFSLKDQTLQWLPNRDYATNSLVQKLLGESKAFLSKFDDLAIHGPLLGRKSVVAVDEITETWEDVLTEQGEHGDFVLLNHVSPVLGMVRDIRSILKVCRDLGIMSVVDFSFSACQHDINSLLNSVDFGIVDGTRDMFAPPGACFVISKENELFPGLLGTRNVITYENLNTFQVNRNSLEMGVPDLYAAIGFQHSIGFIETLGKYSIFDSLREHSFEIDRILSTVSNLQIPVIGEGMKNFQDIPSNIKVFSFPGFSAHDFALIADEAFNVKVRSGLLCSHWGIKSLGWDDAVQVSTHCYNDASDFELFKEALEEYSMFV